VRRHEIDVVSLAAGLLFLAVAVVHMVAGATDTDLNLRWMVPVVLVLLGVIGMLGAMRGRREQDDVPAAVAEPVSTTVAEPVAEPEGDSEVVEEVDEPSAK
jgi:hypothetical protein